MNKKISLFDIINGFVMLIVGVIILYPIIYVVSVSFSDTIYIVQNKITFYPKGFNLDAYKMILKDNRIPRSYLNTILYTSAGTIINLLMTAMGAYPLAKKNFFGRKFFVTAIVITMFFSGGMIPSFIVVQKLGLINSMWALIIPNAIWTTQLLILKSFYESISPSLYEAAIVDGASEYRILFQIIIPLSKPALASLALFYFMGHWNSYFLPLIYLNDLDKLPLQVILRDMLIDNTASNPNLMTTSKLTPEAMKNATIFLSMVPVLMIYPFVQKYFAKGIMLGSVKG
jgi:putative aldouronate transport system permease protein